MDFQWVVGQLILGHKVRRSSREKHWYYMYANEGISHVNHNSGKVYRGYFDVDEFMATDWELFKEPKETLSDKILFTDRIQEVNEAGLTITISGTYRVVKFDDVKEFLKQAKKLMRKRNDILTDKEFLAFNKELDELVGNKFKD